MKNSFNTADILIPQGIDMTKWSVVACDQFTSEPEYWNETKKIVSSSPSSLNLIFPEIYLSEGDDRINSINKKMKEYLSSNLFMEYKNSFIFVKRLFPGGKVRRGLVGAIDLEDYDFNKGSKSNVRATEGTVLDRIPPRVKIRENAPLELPHIMILIDDPKKQVIEPLDNNPENLEKIYDFELMQNGGHIKGYLVSSDCSADIRSKLCELSSEKVFQEKYNVKDIPVLTFAVGDGNHSLATAKTCWENLKKNLSSEEIKKHPARFALAELVNLHDESLEFEPIHRVMFGVNPSVIYNLLLSYFPEASESDNGGNMLECVFGNIRKKVWIKDSTNNLIVGSLQNFIDNYLSHHPGSVDYIHGEKVVLDLCSQDGNIGFLLPAMKKSELFKTVILDGSLPRKTFSMGEANEKRYYLEGKKIK